MEPPVVGIIPLINLNNILHYPTKQKHELQIL